MAAGFPLADSAGLNARLPSFELVRRTLGARAGQIEPLAAVVLILAVLLFVALHFLAMSQTSLWTDELGTIKHFIAKGPWAVMTDYSLPRNHIFFSLLNALLPGRELVDPLRARMLSFVFAALVGVSLLVFFGRRRLFLAGAFAFFLWGMSGGLLELSLQSRGYGLLCLLALWSSMLVVRYLESGALRAYALLAVCSVLGIYTIPLYVVFAGPLLLTLWLWRPRWPVFATAAGAALGTFLLYLPVLRQMLSAMRGYAQRYGEFYVSLASVGETFEFYVCALPPAGVFLVVLALAVLPFALRFSSEALALAVRLLVANAFLFLAVCLWLKTPPVRTTAFLALPLGFAAALCLTEMLRRPPARALGSIGLAGLGVFCAHDGLQRFQFVPCENWTETVAFVEAMFPPGATVDISRGADGYSYYADQDRYRLRYDPVPGPLPEAFLGGQVPLVVALWNKQGPAAELSLSALPAYPRPIVVASAPGRSRDILVYLALPAQSGILSCQDRTGAEITATHDGRLTTAWTPPAAGNNAAGSALVFRPVPGRRCHSFNFLCSGSAAHPPLVAVTVGGRTAAVPPERLRFLGNVVSVPLEAAAIEQVQLEFPAAESPADQGVSEAWFRFVGP